MTAPSENGDGARLSMERALKSAKMTPNDIDYINAHATSTPLGDRAESAAITSIFGDRPSSSSHLSISSTKGATGHLLGASGAVEAIFSILAIEHVSKAL
jgi:3-oxoacyl-[acyl-carrier-protein] synthase II